MWAFRLHEQRANGTFAFPSPMQLYYACSSRDLKRGRMSIAATRRSDEVDAPLRIVEQLDGFERLAFEHFKGCAAAG